jgi:hypothetical protein
MKRQAVISLAYFLFFLVTCSYSQTKYPVFTKSSGQDEIKNQLSEQYMPVIGVWNWSHRTLEPDGFKNTIDQASKHSPFNLLIPFLRFPDKEVVDDEIYNQVKLAAEYAVEKNLALVPDLDVRSARRAFQSLYPEELQEMLRLQEVILSQNDYVETTVTSIDNLSDHYSGGRIPKYDPLESSLLRVYSYTGTEEGIDPETLKNITDQCDIVYSAEDSLRISIPPGEDGRTHASVMVSFTIFYPDVFSPHLMEFQRSLIRQYADVPLAGACKDEWGFPPYFPRYAAENTYDYWYSRFRAQDYAERSGGRELLADCLLMAKGFKGREVERQVAINHFRETVLQRNIALEGDFYDVVKEVFGPDAAVTVHPTWWPYPDLNEMRKNGLDWWGAKRDWAQTDEIVPFGARTALSKKWGNTVWYHMYYTRILSTQVWSSVLAGGRIDYLSFQTLYDPDIMRAENRIRLLNAINPSPLDCLVAIIFGHPASMNWAGPYFNDVGMEMLNLLWNTGYPADLIPTSEIGNGSLRIDEDGWINYGEQRYAAVVLYHPEFERESTSEFFLNASNSKTAMFRVGDWTRDFEGKPVDVNMLLPGTMKVSNDYRDAYLDIIEILKDQNIPAQTPATEDLDSRYFSLRDFDEVSKFPPTTGFCRLIDGTIIHIAGTNDISGDPIMKEFKIGEYPVTFDAIGIAAVRLDEDGEVQALAAGSLKSFKSGDFEINLDERIDLALWVDDNGQWKGIIQGWDGTIPQELKKITHNWDRLNIPDPPESPFNPFR